MLNNFKISHKMFIGAFLMVAIIATVGYFGIRINDKVEAQNYIIEASRNVVVEINEGREVLDRYLSVDSFDRLDNIEKEIISNDNSVRGWIGVLSRGIGYNLLSEVKNNEQAVKGESKSEKDIILSKEADQITKDIERLRAESQVIYNDLIKNHEELLKLKKAFDENYLKSENLKYAISKIVYSYDNVELVKRFDKVLYLSKEALYQYKDKEHISEWLESISILKNLSESLENSELVSLVGEYFSTSGEISVLVTEIDDKKEIETIKKGEYEKYFNDISLKKDELNEIISGIISETKATDNILLFVVILASIFLGVLLAFVITRSITVPIKKLSESAKKVADGNLSHRVQIKGNDELSGFAEIFNEMTHKLQKARSEIDKKVIAQTKEISGNQKYLQDQQKALVNILEDINEERIEASKERDKIRTILQGIGDGVFVVDNNFDIIVFNKIAEEISGFSAKEAIGKKYYDILKFVYEDNLNKADDFIRETVLTGKPRQMANHAAIIRKDKTSVPVADSAAPLKDFKGSIVGCVVVFRDVTREREIDKAKTEFVSLASHQLRTPLSSINWYTEMLMSGDAGKINENQKEYLKEVYTGSKRMVDLVNALLNVSRIELGTFAVDPEPVLVTEIIKSVLKELNPGIKEKKIKVSKNCGKDIPTIKADPKLLRIVFQNLLSNAVKYTRKNGSISIEARKAKEYILCKIKDTGMGIPKNQQKNIFTKLFRASNVRATNTEGTGLGLYITKAIIDNSKGKIWFSSVEGQGTTFSIKIPLKGMTKREGTKELNYEK